MSEPLADYEQHKSAEDVAEYFLTRNVGRKYRTHEEVWNAPDELVTRGLLSLILKEIRQTQSVEAAKDACLETHRDWLRFYYEADKKLCDSLRKQRARVSAMIGKNDLRQLEQRDDLSWLQRRYVQGDFLKHEQAKQRLIKTLKQLKSVKTVADLSKIDGIGKVTVQKFLARS